MDQYRVFGNPIEQSRSPFIHQAFAQQTQQNLAYQSQLVPLEQFTHTVQEFINQGGKGANVTVPFKEEALALCDHLSERAELAGAVNTLIFKENKIFGDNTDGLGLVQDLLRQHVVLANKRILLLGAGGAAKGVMLPLLAQNPSAMVVANRTVSKAQQLCQQFANDKITACSFEQANQQDFDIIINATSASLNGAIPPISADMINAETVCYDMVYGAALTPFLVWAKAQGSEHIIDGLGMLVGQAAESFSLWRGVMPETANVLQVLRDSLTAS